MFCLCTVVVPGAYRGQKMESESPGIRVMDGCESHVVLGIDESPWKAR